MRSFVILGLGLVLTLLAAPAAAGTLADYKATSGKFKTENGVRVYRVLPTKQQVYNAQDEVHTAELAFERGYKEGFETGLNASQKKATLTRPKRKTRRSRYNYGRRYSTSGQNPRFSRFRSNISYGRPAYSARTNNN